MDISPEAQKAAIARRDYEHAAEIVARRRACNLGLPRRAKRRMSPDDVRVWVRREVDRCAKAVLHDPQSPHVLEYKRTTAAPRTRTTLSPPPLAAG